MSAIRAVSRVCYRGERGQVLILFVGVFTVILMIAAVVIDFGLWFSERRSVQQAADFAALAGAQDLLSDDGTAMASAYKWAKDNGFENGAGGVEVTVQLLCRNSLTSPPQGICHNTSAPAPGACQIGAGCDSLQVTIKKPATHLFTQLFGVGDIAVTSGAAAVAGIDLDVPKLDTIVARDVSGSMLPGCYAQPPPPNSNPGCPLKESRDAAHDFVDILTDADGSSSQLGYVPYNYCYAPPPPAGQWPSQPFCVSEAHVIGLTSNGSALHTAIDQAEFPHATNICLPLLRANQMFAGPSAQPGPGVQRAVLLLTAGDNNYSTAVTYIGGGFPPPPCLPNGTGQPPERNCGPAWDADQDLDVKTYRQAQALTAQGVEIYVVGLAVCGSDDGHTRNAPGYCAGIGDSAHDNVANQRLLKCVASAADHYLPVTVASELPAIFRLVAGRIAGRGLLR